MKPKPKSESSDRNITKMVICMCFISLMGNFPLALSIIYDFFDSESIISTVLTVLSNALDVLSHSVFLLVYLKFNILFKKTFKALSVASVLRNRK